MSKFISRDHAQEFTNKIISLIESGEMPWRKPWTSQNGLAARSFVSKAEYSGINILLLLVSTFENDFDSPYWLTMKQANDLGGKVKKGSKGTAITYYSSKEIDDETAAEGKKTIHFRKFFTVFNLDQIEGIEAPLLVPSVFAERSDDERKIDLENYLSSYRDSQGIGYEVKGAAAYYSPVADKIVMPSNFSSVGGYCGTLAHEHIHATGHEKRFDRFSKAAVKTKEFKDDYSAEELVAEVGAGLLCGSFGITSELENHASYIQSWLKHLKNDKEFIFKAAAKATKAINHIAESVKVDDSQAAA